MSFDVWDSESPRFEIYGEEGTICIPDPDPVHGANQFQGEVWYRTRETSCWSHQPRPQGRDNWQIAGNLHGYNDNFRGLGLLDLAFAVRDKRPPRASGALALHVFEIMSGILDSLESGSFYTVNSRCAVPPLLPANFPTSETQN